MPKKLTAAELEAKAREAVRRDESKRAEAKIVLAAIAAQRPDMETAFICGEAPLWFERIVWTCKIKAAGEAIRAVVYSDAAYRSAPDEEAGRVAFHDAYLPAFEKAFSTLLTWELRKHDAESGT
jgi:hypothetical protein